MRKLFTLCAVLLLVSAVAYAQPQSKFTAYVDVMPYLETYNPSVTQGPSGLGGTHAINVPGETDGNQAIFHNKLAYCNHYVDISVNLQPFWRLELLNPGEAGPAHYDWLVSRFSMIFYWGGFNLPTYKTISTGTLEPAYPAANPTAEPAGTDFAIANSGNYVAHDGLIFLTMTWSYSSNPITDAGNGYSSSDDAGRYQQETVITYTLHSFAP